MKCIELIDTLWNVNYLDIYKVFRQIWINRYIMECKYLKIDGKYGESTGINRYIMECKSRGYFQIGDGYKN